MRKLSLLLIGLFMLPMLILTSCDRGDDPVVNQTPKFDLMKDYMVANNYDLDKILTSPDGKSFVVDAPATEADVAAFLSTYYIIDLRSAADFATGRVNGAKNVAFANILTEAANAGTKDILVVCYTGNTATYATSLLRLYGYRNARALKWGMSGWNTNFNTWASKIGNTASGHANWSFEAAATPPVYSAPTISSTGTDGLSILKKRVEAVVAEGTKVATVADVLANPTSYFINNYFSAADYTAYGHVKGAYRIQPLTLGANNHLNLNPSATAKIATYCYTGQTSGAITAWLRVLGYDAYTINFGMNGFWNDNPGWGTSGNKWTNSKSKSLSVVN
jgi:rhodanese-related sulfurtransferase